MVKKVKPGDIVNIKTSSGDFEGILMPRPALLGDNVTIIKLDSGYNIGIDNDKIKRIKLVKQYKSKPQKKSKKKSKNGLPKISLLSLGGTISSKVDYNTGGTYADYTAQDFVDMIPELRDVANLEVKNIMSMMSEDISFNEYDKIGKAITDELKSGSEGVVVTVGTDTLHFITAAMSFILEGLDKPVIFTAAQRSIDRGSSDAFMNLLCAINAAANFDGAGVMSCLHGTSNDDFCLLIRGTKVRKMHTSRRDAFRAINELPLAKVFTDGKINIFNKNYNKKVKSKSKVKYSPGFENVQMVYVYPSINPKVIDFHIKQGAKGIVIAATALGHVPTDGSKNNVLPFIKKANKKDIPVIIASQTIYGRVHPYVYTNLRKVSVDSGGIFVEDMLPEVAYIKLAWLLARKKGKAVEFAKEKMLENIAGELNDRSNYDSYL